jgi:hypothetical protein
MGNATFSAVLRPFPKQTIFVHRGVVLINRLTESPALGGCARHLIRNSLLLGGAGDHFGKRLLIVSDLLRTGSCRRCLCSSAVIVAALPRQRTRIVGAFYPARAIIPTCPPCALSANTLIQVSYILALIFGATLAGFVIKLWGPALAILFDSATFAVSAALLALMRIPPNDTAQSHESARTVWGQLVQGLRYVTGSHLLVRVLAITAIAALGIGAIQILGLNFLSLRLNVTEQGFGLTMAMVGIGVAIGGAFVQRLASRTPANQVVGLTLAGVGIAIIVFALAPNFGLVRCRGGY